ncbi:MAG: protein kinase [Planctomycetota bacterium]|nr:protein kinase [Planctomycetota bacterium]
MADASHEAYFQELLAKGMAGAEEVAEARRLMAEAAARGRGLSAAEALLRAGARAAHAHHAAPAAAPDAATDAAEAGAAAAMPSSDLEVLEKLGRGSQAVVFRCRQISLDRIVAAKILLARIARDPEARERFLSEARQAANLSHPNIVTIHQILPFKARSASGGEPIDTFCIVMECVDGGSVAELLAARKRFDPAEAACIIRSVAEALVLAHGRGIIHRDIKPANILLTQGGMVKLADLGLAMPLSDAQQAGQAGRACGTPYYISPEQVRGDAAIDCRADLYSLAATFYQMVVGEPPFTAATPREVVRKHLLEKVPDPRLRVPELPDALCRMLMQGMAKDRKDRYESAEHFIVALDRIFPAPVAAVVGSGEPQAAGQGHKAAPPAADQTVPASAAMLEQLAAVPESERRRADRVDVLAAKAAMAATTGRATATHAGRPAHADAARDPERARKRKLVLISTFGVLVVLAAVVTTVVIILFPPPSDPGAKAPRTNNTTIPPTPPVAPPEPPKETGPAVANTTKPPEPPKEEKPPAPPAPQVAPPAPQVAPPAPQVAPPAPQVAPPAPQVAPPAPPPAPPKEEKPPAPPGKIGTAVILRAANAKITGPNAKYEKHGPPDIRDNIGHWNKADTSVSWKAQVPHAGTYAVEVTYARDNTNSPGAYIVDVAGKKLKGTAKGTGSWGNFMQVRLGMIFIDTAGPATITVRPVSVPGDGLMNLQAVTLTLVGP